MKKLETMKLINVFTLVLISEVNLFHSKPLDALHPSLIETFLQNFGINKNILTPLSIQKKNESLSLKDHRFNCIFECYYSLAHYVDAIKFYLEKFSSVVNGLSIIDRSFLDMEVLNPFLCATSLIGIDITGPTLYIKNLTI